MTSTIADRLAALDTPALSDALDRLGIDGQVVGILPLDTSFVLSAPRSPCGCCHAVYPASPSVTTSMRCRREWPPEADWSTFVSGCATTTCSHVRRQRESLLMTRKRCASRG